MVMAYRSPERSVPDRWGYANAGTARPCGCAGKIATLAKIPVITTASVPQGPNGPLIPEIHANAPHAQYVARKGEINAWDNPDFVAAVKATGRKTLIIAAITSVCMAFPISAVADGYRCLR
jgi:nicotinamidase-related amidase